MATEKIGDVATQTGKFKCHWCPERRESNVERYNHERNSHPDEFQERAAERMAAEESGGQDGRGGQGYSPSHQPFEDTRRVAGLHMAELHEYTKKFATSLQSAAPTMADSRKQQLILKFDEEATRISQDPQLLDRFLLRAGLMATQTEYIKLVMLPIDGGQPGFPGYPGSGAPGQPQVYSFNPQTGQMAPIIVMGAGQSQPQNQPNMPFIMMPSPQHGQADPNALTRYDLMEFAEKLATKLQPPAREPAPRYETPIKRYQRIVTDDEGNPVKDGDQVLTVWVEEPVIADGSDGFAKAIDTLTKLGIIGQKPEPGPSAQEIAELTVSKAAALLPQQPSGPSPEIQELSKKLDTVLAEREKDAAVNEAVEKAGTLFATQMQPLVTELETLRGHQGLSDHQAGLAHAESMQKTFLLGLNSTLSGFRQDLQPMFMQQMVAQFKALGLQDGTIADLVARMTPVQTSVAEDLTGAKADAMRRWVA